MAIVILHRVAAVGVSVTAGVDAVIDIGGDETVEELLDRWPDTS